MTNRPLKGALYYIINVSKRRLRVKTMIGRLEERQKIVGIKRWSPAGWRGTRGTHGCDR
jgi:hypothetical protein